MTIRPYAHGDQESVLQLWRESGLVAPWNDPRRDIARKTAVDAELFLVGEIDGRVVATVMAGYEGHRGWINYLAVSPEHRRHGHGRLLLVEAERRLEQRGCPKVNLQVRETNDEVISFYRALGYTRDKVVSLGKRLFED